MESSIALVALFTLCSGAAPGQHAAIPHQAHPRPVHHPLPSSHPHPPPSNHPYPRPVSSSNGNNFDIDTDDLVEAAVAVGAAGAAAWALSTALSLGTTAAVTTFGTSPSISIVAGRKKRAGYNNDKETLAVALKFFDIAAELDGKFKCLPKIFCKIVAKEDQTKLNSLEKAVLKLQKKIPTELRDRFVVSRPADFLIYGAMVGEVGKERGDQQAVCFKAFPQCSKGMEKLLEDHIEHDLEELEALE